MGTGEFNAGTSIPSRRGTELILVASCTELEIRA